MRIAIASSGLGNTARGIEAWAKSLAEGLHREGENVILFHGGGTYSCPNIKLNYLHRDTLPIRLITRLAPRFAWRWGLTSRYGLEQRLFTRALLRWLRQHPEERSDIIHTQDYVVAKRLQHAAQACLGVVPPYPAGRSRIIFGNASDEPPATLNGLPYLHHISQPDYDAAIAEPSLATAKHFLAPSFVDTTHFTPATPEEKAQHRRTYGIPEDAFVIGCVAALQRHHKRLDALIDEVANLSSIRVDPCLSVVPPDHHLVLAGAVTDDTPTIERYAHDKLGPSVTILKDQPFDSMPSIYQSMDLLVHPAPEEVFGLCFVEAMACGIPVIAHHSPRLQYVVGKGGWLTDVMRKGFLGVGWAEISRGLPERAVRCRQHVGAHFSWAAVYQEYMGMYRGVIG